MGEEDRAEMAGILGVGQLGLELPLLLLHLPRELAPAAVSEFARVTRADGALLLTVAEGDFEGFQSTGKYDDRDLRRWFTYHREPDLRGLLAATGYRVTDAHRHTSNRDWLTLYASRG